MRYLGWAHVILEMLKKSPVPSPELRQAGQGRSHQFSMLTYWKYAPRPKPAVAFLNDLL
jgi:hypothetical protein